MCTTCVTRSAVRCKCSSLRRTGQNFLNNWTQPRSGFTMKGRTSQRRSMLNVSRYSSISLSLDGVLSPSPSPFIFLSHHLPSYLFLLPSLTQCHFPSLSFLPSFLSSSLPSLCPSLSPLSLSLPSLSSLFLGLTKVRWPSGAEGEGNGGETSCIQWTWSHRCPLWEDSGTVRSWGKSH